MLTSLVMPSPLGPLTVIASPLGVRQIHFGNEHPVPEMAPSSLTGASILAAASSQLHAYLAGQRQVFSLPLDLKGTHFQMQVWRLLLRIPYGETRSYQWLAEQLGNPQAAQAVGQANGQNPIPVIVPCHRIIAADGDLAGYSGGLDRKRFLLGLEGSALPFPPPFDRPAPPG